MELQDREDWCKGPGEEAPLGMEAIQPDAYVEPDRHVPMEGAERGGLYGIHRSIQGRTVELRSRQAGKTAAIAPEDRPTAQRLAQMNRRGRHAFWSARRHGASEEQAFTAAARTLPR